MSNTTSEAGLTRSYKSPVGFAFAVASAWFLGNFASAILWHLFLFTPIGSILGCLYDLQAWLYEHIFFFDKKRDILPGIGVFVQPQRVLGFIAMQCLVLFLAVFFTFKSSGVPKGGP